MDNYYTSLLLFTVLKAQGIHAAGTCHKHKSFPLTQLQEVQLARRSQVAWLVQNQNGSTTIRWKDRKDIFFLSSMHNQPEVPE